jgi:hypothetical protein
VNTALYAAHKVAMLVCAVISAAVAVVHAPEWQALLAFGCVTALFWFALMSTDYQRCGEYWKEQYEQAHRDYMELIKEVRNGDP